MLDAGTGIGGTARFVADRCQCRVTAVDLTEEAAAIMDMVLSLCLPIRWGCTPSSLALRRRPRTSALPSRTDGCELSNASRERADQVGEYLCDVKPEAMHGI